MQYKDYYRVLGVAPSANEEDIRKAYKKLAVQFHPDNNPDNPAAEERFKAISEAKEILLDPDNRRQYDALRRQYEGYRAAAGAGAGRSAQQQVPKDFNNLFGRFMNEIINRQKKKQIKGHLKISLREAYHGVQQQLRMGDTRVKVKIPKGVRHEQKLRLHLSKSGGEDVFIRIVIEEDPDFRREGDNLYTATTIDLYDAVLGRKVPVQTLKGQMMVSIPPGTQPGDRLKLKGMGMPNFEIPSYFGDLYLKVQVKLHKKISSEEKVLFESLEKIQNNKKA
ncbi:MAG: J domain-containing protein [Bacteroidota bacterium]